MKNIIFLITVLFVFSCSSKPSRPQLYPNEKFHQTTNENAQTDIDQCLSNANEYLKTPAGEKLKDSLGTGSLSTSIGFGFGSSGTSTGIGLGYGNRPYRSRLSGEEQVRRNFTNQCLVNKGYQIVGWEN